MINKTTSVINSGRTFQVAFDCYPKAVRYDGSHTQPVFPGPKRNGIEEGVKVTRIEYKIGSNGWQVWAPGDPNNKNVILSTDKNGEEILVKATYEIWTMGFPSMSYPFFYYGNFGGNPARYQSGYFSDASPANPNNFRAYAKVPSDWSLKSIGWVQPGGNRHLHSWCYQQSEKTVTTWHGTYERRNGQHTSNGWTSETGNPNQESRHHVFWVFTKEFTSSVTSANVIMNPSVPELTVISAKGDKGNIKIKNNDDNMIIVKVGCKNKRTGQIIDQGYYSNQIIPGKTERTYEQDFFEMFGEDGRGSDLHYYAIARNNQGYASVNGEDFSKVPDAQWKGTHRYNGRPTVPTGVRVTGRDNVYYDNLTINWNRSTDPDNDVITYIVVMMIEKENHEIIFNDIIATTTDTTCNYNIASYPEGVKCSVFVKATDRLLDSAVSTPFTFTKGEAAKQASNIYPLNNSILYNKRPRILVDLGGQTNVNVKVTYKGVTYNSATHQSNFSIYQGKCVFKMPVDLSAGANQVSIQTSNAYGDSAPNVMNYTLATNPYNTSSLDPNVIISGSHMTTIRTMIDNIRKAFGYPVMNYTYKPDGNIYVKDYTETYSAIQQVNGFINDFVMSETFDVSITKYTVAVGTVIDDSHWDEIVTAINNV